jgi:hypothetical protein
MAAPGVATPLNQELVAVHALALECAARAGRFLDGATTPGPNERTSLEAVRMAGLAARLMEGVGQVVPRLRGLLAAGAPTTVCGDAEKGRSSAPAASSAPKLHAALGQPRGRLKNGNPSGRLLEVTALRRPHARGLRLSPAGHDQRPLPAAWRPQHRPAYARGPGALSHDPPEAWLPHP